MIVELLKRTHDTIYSKRYASIAEIKISKDTMCRRTNSSTVHVSAVVRQYYGVPYFCTFCSFQTTVETVQLVLRVCVFVSVLTLMYIVCLNA